MASAEGPTVGGLCDACVSGVQHSGTPAGSESKIGPFDTVYVARPTGPLKSDTAAIVIFTDVFGLKLVNNKLVADKIANASGLPVYVPDLFFGEALDIKTLHLPATPDEIRSQGILAKVKSGLKIAGIVPWFLRHRPGVHMAAAKEFVTLLKTPEYGYTKLGAIGYCYGAKMTVEMNSTALTAASAFVHPSMLGEADIDALKTPATFALAELDQAFSDKFRDTAEQKLRARNLEAEFVVYEGTTHGFAVRGDLELEATRKGEKGAIEQVANWFVKYLVN